jgi:hypothetical protein
MIRGTILTHPAVCIVTQTTIRLALNFLSGHVAEEQDPILF